MDKEDIGGYKITISIKNDIRMLISEFGKHQVMAAALSPSLSKYDS